MSLDRRSVVLRVLDDQNRLGERADVKSLYLLSALGFFTAFFIAYSRDITMEPVSVALLAIFLISAILALVNIIMAINPRIRPNSAIEKGKLDPYRASFFAEICKFPSLSDYKQCLNEMLTNEDVVLDVYTRQIYEVSQITAAKYRYTSRAVYLVITALTSEFVLIAYLFATRLAQ